MKRIFLDIHDDATFSGSISEDGRVLARVNGNTELTHVAGMVKEFTELFGALMKPTPVNHWQIQKNTDGLWTLILPTGCLTFRSECAAVSARAFLRPLWPALVKRPTMLYEAFYTGLPSQWGYLDIDGTLHGGFDSESLAQGAAHKDQNTQLEASA